MTKFRIMDKGMKGVALIIVNAKERATRTRLDFTAMIDLDLKATMSDK